MNNQTIDFNKSLETINEYFNELGLEPISEKVAREDFGIQGGETDEELKSCANDYASEVHTEICASKNQWRYEI